MTAKRATRFTIHSGIARHNERSRVVRATISGADHPFYTAASCSARVRRCDFAFPCVALPRRHGSTASTPLGCQSQCVGDQLFGCFLSLVHVPALVLDRLSVSICPAWYGLWRHSRPARFSDDSLGKPTRRPVLHSEPVARINRDVCDRCTVYLRLVARHALWQRQRSRRSSLADHGLRNAAFSRHRFWIDRILSGLLHWSSPATRPPGAQAVQLKCICGKSVNASAFCAEAARDSNPTTHFPFILQIRFIEFRCQMFFFAKDDAVMKDQAERNNKEQCDPVVKKKAECNLQKTKRQIHRITGEAKRPATHDR